MKHLGSPPQQEGRHLVDARVYADLRLQRIAAADASARVVTGDLLTMIGGLDVEVAYFDPPYNARQYCDNYHVLETIARWREAPAPVHGVTRKARRPELKSPFSRRRDVVAAFRALVVRCRARRIYISYSSEGILGVEELGAILRESGRVQRWRFDHPVFGNGAGVAKRRTVDEYLFELIPYACS